jgi:hypothetical protein
MFPPEKMTGQEQNFLSKSIIVVLSRARRRRHRA